MSLASEEAVQETNSDASVFKAYAVSRGYWHDPFISHFVSPSKLAEHRAPEMSRGYYARVDAIRSYVQKFLAHHHKMNLKCQVVNLGAGFDTLYFLLRSQHSNELDMPRKFVEVDLPRIVATKCRTIKQKKLLEKLESSSPKRGSGDVMPPPPPPPPAALKITPGAPLPPLMSLTSGSLSHANELHSANYDIVPCDLRNAAELDKRLSECDLDRSLPTLFIAECVLVYITNEQSTALLKSLTKSFSQCSLVLYDPTNLCDHFGQIMVSNMEQRACKFLGIEQSQSLTAMKKWLRDDCGFKVAEDESASTCQACTMSEYYKSKMNQAERTRIEAIEFLDESELLFQLMDHYCICVATNNLDLRQILL